MNKYVILIPILFILELSCSAQGIFSVGAKWGLGGSPIPLHATLISSGVDGKVYGGTSLTTSLLTQYTVGNGMGIESGLHLNHYSFYRKDDGFWRRRIWKGSAAIEMVDYQIPLVLLYSIGSRSPFSRIIVAGGTSIDLLTTSLLQRTTNALWLKNVYGSIRLSKPQMSGSRIEYGLEFQYSLNSFSIQGTNNNQLEDNLSSHLGMMTLNFYYFFWNKPIGRT